MLMVFLFIVFLVVSYIRPLLLEIERRDALLLNATLSSNKTQFLSVEWLREGGLPLLENSTEGAEGSGEKGVSKGARSSVEPDWSIVLGTFTHTRDEGFEEFLIAAGLGFFTRSIILSISPTVTVERDFEGYDYYYDLPSDSYSDVKYDYGKEGGRGGAGKEDGRDYPMIVTTVYLFTVTQRFRLNQPYVKDDYDGTPSKNTCVFKTPTVLFQYKEKERGNTTFVYEFDEAGVVMTIINETTGLQARRYFQREDV